MSFISYLINGISLGSVYAIIALGYTMVYGIAKMLNFAHGDVIMIGAYTIFATVSMAGLPPVLGILLSVVLCTLLGIAIEAIAYRPLRQASSSLVVLITAIGVSYFLQNIALLIFGANTKAFTSVVNVPSLSLAGGQITISGETIVTILSCIVIMIGLTLFVNKTKAGQAMLAVSEDKAAAKLMGINVNATISKTFAIGSCLATFASIFYLMQIPTVEPTLGSMPGIKAFTASVIGGIGSVPGAVVGAIIIGIVESLARAFGLADFADVISFALLIIILVVKPNGIFGEQTREKV